MAQAQQYAHYEGNGMGPSAPHMPQGAFWGAGVDQNRIPGLNALARGVRPKLDRGFQATRESKHDVVKAQYWQLKYLSCHVKDNCLRSCLRAVKETKKLADVMSQSGGDLTVFYYKMHEPATHRALFSALQALENCKLQIGVVARDVNDFLDGADISKEDVLAALSKAEKELERNGNAALLCKDVEAVLGATGVVIGAAGTVVSLAAAHLAVGGAVAAAAGAMAVGTGGAVAVIALIGLLVYLHRAGLKKKVALSRAQRARLSEASREMLDFIAAIAVFGQAVEAIHAELSKLCRECELLKQRAHAAGPGEFPGLQSALYQGERVYKDCQAYEQFLHVAIGSIVTSLEDTSRMAEPAKGRVAVSEPVKVARSGFGCWGQRR